MKLSFKTLQQKSFSIEVENDKIVHDLKQALSTRQDLSCDVEQMKLIFKGKILQDELKCEEIGAGEKDFIVLMITKKKVQTASPVPATPTPTSAVKSPAPEPVPAASTTSASSPVATSTAAAAASTDENTLATGSTLQVAISNLVDMGFPRDQVMLAMRAAFNNPDRAAEYLMTGIPENLQTPAPETTSPAPTTTAAANAPQSGYVNLFNQGAQQAQTTPAAATGPGNLDFLRQSPQFLQLRQMVQQRPELLQPLLQEIAHNNPELINMIQQNQDQFMNLLSEGIPAEEEEGAAENVITITPEENSAIERLCSLGFDRNLAIEAYFACDKNEELAANYLFDMGQ